MGASLKDIFGEKIVLFMAQKRSKKLNDHEKKTIINSYAIGISPAVVAGQLEREVGCIMTFYSRYKFNLTLPPKEKKSKGYIQGRMCLIIKLAVLENPKLSVSKLAQKIKEYMPSQPWYPKGTCLRKFLKSNNFVKRRPALKPPLSNSNRLKRLAFAKKWLINGVCTLENVIWTDETRVASHPNNRIVELWTNLKNVPEQIKMHSGGNSVMFWGCFSRHGTGPLTSILGTVDHKEYINILKDNLIPEVNIAKATIPGTWRLMQDNAPCHTARPVKAFLARNNVEFIEWPPYSPDLNPIENIWHWMKCILETEYPVCNSAEEIEERFLEIWGRITPEMCSNYCGQYEKRLKAVIDANGGYTKY